MSIDELKRRQGVFEAILAGMPTDSPDRSSYENDLNKIKAEIESLEPKAPLSEKVEENTVPSEPEVETEGGELDMGEVPPVQDEELVLPPGKPEERETAPETKPEGEVKEPVKAPEGEVMLAQVPTKALFGELVNRIVNFMKQ